MVIFLLFLLQARAMKGAYLSPSITASTSVQRGATVLQVYLATPLDTPREVFIPSQLDAKLGSISSANVSTLGAWGEANDECLEWVKRHGQDYFDPEKGWSDDADLYRPPSELCGALFYRTLLFFHTLCASDFFLSVEAPGGTAYIGGGFRPRHSGLFPSAYREATLQDRFDTVEFYARTAPSTIEVPAGSHLLFGTQAASTLHGLVTVRFHCFAAGVSR